MNKPTSILLTLCVLLCAGIGQVQAGIMPVSPATGLAVTSGMMRDEILGNAGEGSTSGTYSSLGRGFAQSLEHASGSSAQAVPPSALQRLGFSPSAAVTRKVNQKFIDALSRAAPSQSAEVRRIFDSDVLSRTFRELLAKFGYSPNNLADVMTAYLILSWETVHNGDATRYPQGIEVVHQRMRRALAGNPQLVRFNDAQKQEFAETLADLAMLSTIARKQLLAQGNTAQLQQLERGVRQTTLTLGVDVGNLQLTNAGFRTDKR